MAGLQFFDKISIGKGIAILFPSLYFRVLMYGRRAFFMEKDSAPVSIFM